MKKSICTMLFAALCCLVSVSPAKAQVGGFGLSEIIYNDALHLVHGFSYTELTYTSGFHYRAYVEGYLYDQSGDLLDSGADTGLFSAFVFTQSFAAPVTQYALYSDHYVIAFFFTEVIIRDPCDGTILGYLDDPCFRYWWYDPWGFGFLPGGFFGRWWGFNGFGPPLNLEHEFIYVGTTGDSLITPPPGVPQPPQCPNLNLEIRTTSAAHDPGVINNTTQPALLAGLVQLQASVSPETTGTYTWAANGNAHVSPSLGVQEVLNVNWTEEGTHRVTVVFKPSNTNCQTSAWVDINVLLPSYSFTAFQQAPRIRDDCISGPGGVGGRAVSVGCGFGDPGISFQVTAQAPSNFISSHTTNGIKLVQFNSAYAVNHTPSGGYECNTRRLSEYDIESGWQLDGFDPMNLFFSYAYFDNTGLARLPRPDDAERHGTVDSPIYGISLYDYFRSHDSFETYLVYYSGPPDRPLFSRPLAKIPWSFSTEIFFSSPGEWTSYTTSPPSMQLRSVPTNVIRPIVYQGLPDWGPCPGNPTPPPPITLPTPEFDPCLKKPWLCDQQL